MKLQSHRERIAVPSRGGKTRRGNSQRLNSLEKLWNSYFRFSGATTLSRNGERIAALISVPGGNVIRRTFGELQFGGEAAPQPLARRVVHTREKLFARFPPRTDSVILFRFPSFDSAAFRSRYPGGESAEPCHLRDLVGSRRDDTVSRREKFRSNEASDEVGNFLSSYVRHLQPTLRRTGCDYAGNKVLIYDDNLWARRSAFVARRKKIGKASARPRPRNFTCR